MKAGIDFGSSLVKAVWFDDSEGDYVFRSTANEPLEELVQLMGVCGVKDVNLAGIGYLTADVNDIFKDFNILGGKGDLTDEEKLKVITAEKKLQVKGVKHLMKYNENPLKSFILASIGTGTSYAVRALRLTIPIPIGNGFAGGFIEGQGRSLGVESYQEMSELASKGESLDTYVKDKLPFFDGKPIGEYIMAHFGNLTKDSSKEDTLATAIYAVSATTAKDVAMLSQIFRWTKDVVYIGTTVSNFPSLRSSLEKYSVELGKRPHFPEKGEYALAMGALHK